MIILSIFDHFIHGSEKSTATMEFLFMLFIFALLGYLLRHVLDNSSSKLKANDDLILDLKLEITQLKDKLNDQAINLDVMDKKLKEALQNKESQQHDENNTLNLQKQSGGSTDQVLASDTAITLEEIAIAKEEELHAQTKLNNTTAVSSEQEVPEEKNEQEKELIQPAEKELPAKSQTAKKAAKKDDLKVIEGIGPAIERWMNENGISSYEEMAVYSGDELNVILEKAGPRFRVHDAGTWGEQAKLLAAGKIEEFNKFTSKLIAGKKVKK
jgi:predicted flap endonuclease-1-like 5' DNA nuclease